MNRTEQHKTARSSVNVRFCAVMRFSEKISLLLRRHGLSARALAQDLKLSNSTVAGWLKSARPHPAQAKEIADYFGLSVDALVDDNEELPELTSTSKIHHTEAGGLLMEEQESYGEMTVEEFVAKHPDKAKGLLASLLGVSNQYPDLRITIKGQSTFKPVKKTSQKTHPS